MWQIQTQGDMTMWYNVDIYVTNVSRWACPEASHLFSLQFFACSTITVMDAEEDARQFVRGPQLVAPFASCLRETWIYQALSTSGSVLTISHGRPVIFVALPVLVPARRLPLH
ncbi:hypothetical protein M0R45_003594 [Rubus argutus]|uniref:Uncharacterized protein n=1 Tax=Rubus argutus TaxID=59490 RepID=A0AAW1YGX5_RUBAR